MNRAVGHASTALSSEKVAIMPSAKKKKDLLKSRAVSKGLGDAGSSVNINLDNRGMSKSEVKNIGKGLEMAANTPKTFPTGEKITIGKLPDQARDYAITSGKLSGIGVHVHKDAMKTDRRAGATLIHEGRHARQLRDRSSKIDAGETVGDMQNPSTSIGLELDAYQHEIRNRGKHRAKGSFGASAYKNYKKLYERARELGMRSNKWEYPRR